VKAIIVEDENPAIENLKFYLKDYPMEIAGTAKNLKDAVKIIEEVQPEVVFLDINLSGENGFDLFEMIDAEFKTIFVTAYDSFALRAFEVNALDYLLKPLVKERIASAMKKLFKEEKNKPDLKKYDIEDTIFISNGPKACFSKLKDICYIEAESCYSKVVFTNKEPKVVPQTLKKWESILPENDFLRVHRAFIINTAQIKEIKKRINGTYIVLLNSKNETIEISRRYASVLKKKSDI
jgi:two-component system, LytTR family, response regulator